MKLIITEPRDFDAAAAREIVEQIAQKPDTVLGTATGNTTIGLHRELVRLHHGGGLDLAKVTLCQIDEYVGLPPGHAASCCTRINEQLLSHVNIAPENVVFPHDAARSPEDVCRRFEQSIRTRGGIDCQVVGIGENGHIGFNEPGTPFEATTHMALLSARAAGAIARWFAAQAEIPREGITMGIKTIMLSKKVLLLAKGADKADIIHRSLFGPVSTDVPASVLQLHPQMVVILDQPAAARI